MRYLYLGDRMTAPALRGQLCDPVRRDDGRCIVGGSKQLVRFGDGLEHVVLRRRLRIVNEERCVRQIVEVKGEHPCAQCGAPLSCCPLCAAWSHDPCDYCGQPRPKERR